MERETVADSRTSSRDGAQPAGADGAANPKYLIPVVRSTFSVLEEISRAERLTLNEVIQRTGVPKSTAFRILTTLSHLGYLVRDDRRRYYASPRLSSLMGEDALAEGLKQISLPHMIRLRDTYGETVNLGRLHQGLVRYVEVVPSEYALRLHETPGATVSLHASALGKAILAFSPPNLAENLLRDHELEAFTRETITDLRQLLGGFEDVRCRGYARDRAETSSLATCVAAPILDSTDRAIAAMSVSGPTSRFDPPDKAPVIEDLLLATAEISKRLREPEASATAERKPKERAKPARRSARAKG